MKPTAAKSEANLDPPIHRLTETWHDALVHLCEVGFQRQGRTDASFTPPQGARRHSGWCQLGVELYAVGQILGHKTPRMTQRYAHLSPDYMAGAVGKLDGIIGGMLPQAVA